MKKYFLIRKHNNQVANICDKLPIYDKEIFKYSQKDITKEELQKIENGHTLIIKNNKLTLKNNPAIEKAISVENLKKEIQQADSIDKLKNILNKLI